MSIGFFRACFSSCGWMWLVGASQSATFEKLMYFPKPFDPENRILMT